ncbi:Pyruvate carboxyltransferase [Senna tora]|uniref:Pyruvate carboxyltransferase n=1 Tax=Senna tora TaxID=362788 RepID=A0A834T0N3_9FABA|nr:Pyruvate carboxyltransferase [Senna tora]
MATYWDKANLTEFHPLKRRKLSTMAHNPREIGWTDSTDSDSDVDMEDAMDNNDNILPQPPPPTSPLRSLWAYSPDHNNFVLYFELPEDMYFMANNGPWAVQGDLLAVFPWEPNMVLNRLVVTNISVWVQLWGLPLEFQTTLIAQRIGELIGDVRGIDWSAELPRNIRFMRVRVRLPIDQPLLMGVMLANDQRELMWATLLMQRFHVNYGLMMVRPYFIPEARRFLNQSYRRSTFVAAFQTPDGIAYRPRNPEPMQFEADTDEEVPPPPNETLQPPVSPQPEEDIDPLAEEWFNNIELDDALLPALGMERIDSDEEDLLSSSIDHTESHPVEAQVPLDPSQLENLDPELESLMEKYCSYSSPIPHPSPGVRLTDSLHEELCQEQGFKWVEFDDGQYGLTNAKLTPDPEWCHSPNSAVPSPQAQHLMANTQWQDILELHDFFQQPPLGRHVNQMEIGESSSARQNTSLPSNNFEIEEMTAGIIVPSGPPHGTVPGFTPNGLLMYVVSGPDLYDDYMAAAILSPVPEETPSEVERGTTEDGTDDSASSINLLAYFANAELHTSPHDLVDVSVAGDGASQLSPHSDLGLHQHLPCVDISVVSMDQDDEATHQMSQSIFHSPGPPSNNVDNRASLNSLEPDLTPTTVKKRALTSKEFKDMLFKRAKLAPLAASGNMKKNLSLTRRRGKRKHRPDTDDTEEGVAELKRARKGLTAEVQEVFKRLVDEMVAMVNCWEYEGPLQFDA